MVLEYNKTVFTLFTSGHPTYLLSDENTLNKILSNLQNIFKDNVDKIEVSNPKYIYNHNRCNATVYFNVFTNRIPIRHSIIDDIQYLFNKIACASLTHDKYQLKEHNITVDGDELCSFINDRVEKTDEECVITENLKLCTGKKITISSVYYRTKE